METLITKIAAQFRLLGQPNRNLLSVNLKHYTPERCKWLAISLSILIVKPQKYICELVCRNFAFELHDPVPENDQDDLTLRSGGAGQQVDLGVMQAAQSQSLSAYGVV